ncbi:MAG: pantetheine-phosphate adenylyltransferase [Deltaproteobacteria bacterium]|nr:pantetheine-phosphate adenylyltransferase [Deltaproteobacteria bacterium]
MPKHIAIYPGTFDPITKGHLDIIKRSLHLFDELIVAVAGGGGGGASKTPLFSVEERIDMIKNETKEFERIRVESFSGLLVNYVKEKGASTVIRGLRVMSDFEYEFQMALTNRKLAPEIETIFMMTADEFAPVSSRFIKEIARLGGDTIDFVTPYVKEQLKKKNG